MPPVPTKLPKVGASYQLSVPPLDVALKVNVPEPQRLAGVVDVTVAATFIVAVTSVLEGVAQVPFTTST